MEIGSQTLVYKTMMERRFLTYGSDEEVGGREGGGRREVGRDEEQEEGGRNEEQEEGGRRDGWTE